MESPTAMVQPGPRTFERWEVPRAEVGTDDLLIRIEATGICGSDVDIYNGRGFDNEYPIIRGHEMVCVVDEIGDAAAATRGLKVGDRVAVDPYMPTASGR
jgi:threonine dehydrogenase-like Zn-dependent dehydrogenase